MISKDAAGVLARARQFKFVREAAGKPNRGRWVEAFQRLGGTSAGQPWCACFVCGILGIWFDNAPPLPYTASCDVILEEARRRGWIVTDPQPGDIFLYMKSVNDATHVGFVTDVTATRFGSIEGNASDPDAPPTGEGYGVFERPVSHPGARKRSGKYVFVRPYR